MTLLVSSLLFLNQPLGAETHDFHEEAIATEWDPAQNDSEVDQWTFLAPASFDTAEPLTVIEDYYEGTAEPLDIHGLTPGTELSPAPLSMTEPTTLTHLATAVHPALVGLLALLLSIAGLIAFDADDWTRVPG